MISDDDIAGLPEDDREAFLKLQQLARQQLDEDLESDPRENSWKYELRYMSTVLAGAKVYGIDDIADRFRMPSHDEEHRALIANFMSSVDHLCMELRLKNAQNLRQFTVAFDVATKTKLSHLLTQVREIVGKLEVSDSKRARLINRIALLQLEIDKDRTRMEALGSFIADIVDTAQPAVDLAMKVARIFGEKKSAEDEARQLPPPKMPKQIEAPKKHNKKLDDEIPF